MLSKFLHKYFICLLIVFFVYLIIYQIFAYWYEKRTNNKYFGYNAFGFGTTFDYGGFGNITGDFYGLKGFSFLNDGIFSDLFSCKPLIESYKNKNKDNNNDQGKNNGKNNKKGNSNEDNNEDNNKNGLSNLQNLTNEINDLSNNLYSLSNQVNQMSIQQGILAQQNLPNQPVQVSGADVYNSNSTNSTNSSS